MAYKKQYFANNTDTQRGTTVVAEHFEHIEDGIVDAEAKAEKALKVAETGGTGADWVPTEQKYGGSVEYSADLVFASTYTALNPHWFPDVGFEWDVYWNDKKYTCPLVMSGGEAFVGNRSLISITAPDTGEPFVFVGAALSNKEPEITAVKKNTATEETVYVIITTHAYAEYNKMPEQYLPNCVVKSVNGKKPDENGNVVIGSIARIGTVELLAHAWKGANNLYSQIVTIEGVTENSQVDLTPSVEQLAIFYEKDLGFVTENEDGVVTVYAIGQKPQNDYIIQVTLTEVII